MREAELMTEGSGGVIGERVAGLEATNKLIAERLNKLDDIQVGTALNTDYLKTMSERMKAGDIKMGQHDERLSRVEGRIKDLDGGNGWPSWVDVQKAHLKGRWVEWAARLFFGALIAVLTLLGTWAAAPIWHR
jgi:hypothetical protein